MIATRFNPLGIRASTPAMRYLGDAVVHYDGVENVGFGVHDANATHWVDLVGRYSNVNLPIGEHTIESDCVRCDTSTQMRVARPTTLFDDLKDGYTAEIVVEFPQEAHNITNSLVGLGHNNASLTFPRVDLNASGWTNGYGGVGTAKGYSTSYASASHSIGQSSFVNTRVYFVLTCDIVNQVSNRWYNGKKKYTYASAALIGNSTPSLVGIAINGNGREGEYGDGVGGGVKYFFVRFCKGILTDEEIQHNYLLNKERFGLA